MSSRCATHPLIGLTYVGATCPGCAYDDLARRLAEMEEFAQAASQRRISVERALAVAEADLAAAQAICEAQRGVAQQLDAARAEVEWLRSYLARRLAEMERALAVAEADLAAAQGICEAQRGVARQLDAARAEVERLRINGRALQDAQHNQALTISVLHENREKDVIALREALQKIRHASSGEIQNIATDALVALACNADNWRRIP